MCSGRSDHLPLLLTTMKGTVGMNQFNKKFRFEAKWTQNREGE